MTRERIIQILNLVMDSNEKFRRSSADYSIGFEVRMRHITLDIFMFDVPEYAIDMYNYTTEVLKDYDNDKIRTVSDPNLEKAEAHIRRLIHDLDS